MKSLLCTDTHLGLYADSDIWIEIVVNFFKYITKYSINNNIKELYHLGDFFDNRKSLNTKTQHASHRIAKILELNKNLHTYIIVGNHDCYYKNQIQPNTLELFKKYNHISVIDKITKKDDILLVPWGEIPDSSKETKYCFGHFAINGFHMNDSCKCKNGLDKITFKDFEKVFSGHFHTPSSNNNIVYIGSPYGQKFNDINSTRGFYEFEDGKLNFIEYKNSPKFIKIYSNNDFDENVKGNIVKLIFEKDYGTNKNQEIIENLLKFNPLLYSINFSNITSYENNKEDLVEIKSKKEISDKFIEKQTLPENIKLDLLKSMFYKIMLEVNKEEKIKTFNGNDIECISVGFKNFLPFGNKWQEINFKTGVSFVVGFNKDKNKSNGAGKSSFLEAIIFALFGKTAREIKQDQIINWKNKKNCKVIFKFKIKDDLYEVERCLKPNSFKILKNGTLIDQDAHKTDYQIMFEDIFGMDVKSFMNLVYSNINSSANILKMKKQEKRAFLEKMFGLEVYSEMNKKCNDKTRDINDKKYKIDIEISSSEEKINESNNLKNKIKEELNSKKILIDNYKEIEEKLSELKNNYPNLNKDIEVNNEKIKNINNKINEVRIGYERELIRKQSELDQLDKEIKRAYEIENIKNENIITQAKINKIVEKTGDLDKIDVDIEIYEKEIKEESRLQHDNDKKKLDLSKELVELKTKIKVDKENFNLIKNGKCPTCKQDAKNPIDNYKKDISYSNKKITSVEKKLKKIENELLSCNEKIENTFNKIKFLHKSKDNLNSLKSTIKDFDQEKNKKDLLESKDRINTELDNFKKEFIFEKEKYIEELNELNNKNNDLVVKQKNITEKQKEADISKSKSTEAKKYIKSLSSIVKEQKEKVIENKKLIEENKLKIIKLNNISDYINYIKIILKDENIKQYTIKQIMPFLNKQTNFYLSEVNYDFYVEIDKWLDVNIKGPGIKNATYDSLSGGERRGIDISLQLSLLDIARTQSGCFPDILVFDELLDSSIDSQGINDVMNIIKMKQKEFGGKIFIITHRQEVDKELADNEYKIIRENGYSTVY